MHQWYAGDGLSRRAKLVLFDQAMIDAAPIVPIALDRTIAGPLHQQIVARLRAAIASGLLAPGARLPASRVFATQLGIARGTVETAYALLAGEGAIVPQGAAGTIVSRDLAGRAATLMRPEIARRGAVLPPADPVRPFRLGLPALDAFPRTLWATLSAREARALRVADLAYPDPMGHPALREAIAAYLGLSRGIVCDPAQVLVTGGFQGAVAVIVRALLRAGDRVWMEDPGYWLAREGLRSAGVCLVPVPVDAEGLRVADGIASAPAARLAVVTPTHQSALGVALSLSRRLALLGWADACDGWIVEDDYDGEFRYAGPPLPAMKSLDRADRVIYAGSFSKVLFPGLRLGYLVLPAGLVDRFASASHLLQGGQPELSQRVVAAFMREGHFARHLRRMRALYARRRAALAGALGDAFGEGIAITLQSGGMHLLARFGGDVPDGELAARAVRAGLTPTALSQLCIRPRVDQGLLLGFTNVAEDQAATLARRLAAALVG
jgi:GntR family transcriptional regulator/MocR family aminotransferase